MLHCRNIFQDGSGVCNTGLCHTTGHDNSGYIQIKATWSVYEGFSEEHARYKIPTGIFFITVNFLVTDVAMWDLFLVRSSQTCYSSHGYGYSHLWRYNENHREFKREVHYRIWCFEHSIQVCVEEFPTNSNKAIILPAPAQLERVWDWARDNWQHQAQKHCQLAWLCTVAPWKPPLLRLHGEWFSMGSSSRSVNSSWFSLCSSGILHI